ncbi:MAG: hypothetical protein ACTSWW_08815, partial [Promethearchaeota archaeon]
HIPNDAVEFQIETQWWLGLIIAPVMPIILIIIYLTDPAFKALEIFWWIFIPFAFVGIVMIMIGLFTRKVLKRFSVDTSTQSLMFEIFWGKFRVVKKVYPYGSISKFEVVLRMIPKGENSQQQIEALALIFQSGKRKYLTGYKDQKNVRKITQDLNNLLQERANFPSENFRGSIPRLPEQSPSAKIIGIFALVFSVALIVTILLVLPNIE